MNALSTVSTVRSSAPALISRQLDTAISRFTNALEAKPGSYTRKVIPSEAAPSDDERRTLAERKADLDRSLAPMDEASLRRAAATLRAAFPASNDGEESAKMTVNLYVAALGSFPEWAVNEICRQYLDGRRGNGTFAPPAPEMAKACREEVAKFIDERAKITTVLDAEVLPPIDEEKARRAAAVMRWEKEIRPQMAAKDEPKKPQETPQQALDRLQETAGQPVTIGDGLAKILTGMKKGQAA